MHVRLQIGFTLLRVYFISNFDSSGVLMNRLVALCVFFHNSALAPGHSRAGWVRGAVVHPLAGETTSPTNGLTMHYFFPALHSPGVM